MSIPNDTKILELTLKEVYERINSAAEDGFSKKSIAALRQCLPSNYSQSFQKATKNEPQQTKQP